MDDAAFPDLGSPDRGAAGPPRFRPWRDLAAELQGPCEKAFRRLAAGFPYDAASLFLYDRETASFRAVKVCAQGETLDGEEEIPVAARSPLRRLARPGADVLVMGAPHRTVFVPLSLFSQALGALRVDRWKGPAAPEPDQRVFLAGLARSLSLAVWRAALAVQDRMRDLQLKTFHEVSVIVHQSLRLGQLLEDVAKRLVRNFGFDRVKIYLPDPRRRVWKGEAGYALFEGALDVSGETLPLVEEDAPDPALPRFLRRAWHRVPLMARRETVGLLSVDNLLSQEEISMEEIHLLDALAGHLGLAVKNASLYEGVEDQAIRDALTRLYLPRYFRERLEQECQRAARQKSPFALCMLDVDKFKAINDLHGHPAGDRALQAVARQLQGASRRIDVAARYAGDEFIVLLPGAGAEQAVLFAQRLRGAVGAIALPAPGGGVIRPTVSVGVAVYPDHGLRPEELIQAADQALYESKRRGRNDVSLSGGGKG